MRSVTPSTSGTGSIGSSPASSMRPRIEDTSARNSTILPLSNSSALVYVFIAGANSALIFSTVSRAPRVRSLRLSSIFPSMSFTSASQPTTFVYPSSSTSIVAIAPR